MAFQLVMATESEITVWHTDHGHIFSFRVDPDSRSLVPRFTRDIPDAAQPAAVLQDDALGYAVDLARERRLIG